MTSSNYSGDEFSEKYKMYGDMLFKLSMVYLGNHVDAEEVMQEAFIKLLYKSPTFTYGDDEKKWLRYLKENNKSKMRRIFCARQGVRFQS